MEVRSYGDLAKLVLSGRALCLPGRASLVPWPRISAVSAASQGQRQGLNLGKQVSIQHGGDSKAVVEYSAD